MTLALAAAHHAAAPAINGLFFATCATVIPVLFLAIAVQAPMLERVIRAYQKVAHPAPNPERTSYPHARAYFTFATNAVRMAAIGVLAAAACGEILALLALYLQHAAIPGSQNVVLVCTVFLTIGAGAPAAMSFAAVLARTWKPATPATQGRPGTAPQAAASPAKPALAEDGPADQAPGTPERAEDKTDAP
jgi:hypothetical protein